MILASWSDLGRILLVGLLAYAALVCILRISGKRTLTKLNAFDLVVTVALGSTLATIILNKSVSLAEGILALALLVFLQFVITAASVRSNRFQDLVKAKPSLLVYKGAFIESALTAERITHEEVLAAMRSTGVSNVVDVDAVVLETDGTLSVLSKIPSSLEGSTLTNVEGPKEVE